MYISCYTVFGLRSEIVTHLKLNNMHAVSQKDRIHCHFETHKNSKLI